MFIPGRSGPLLDNHKVGHSVCRLQLIDSGGAFPAAKPSALQCELNHLLMTTISVTSMFVDFTLFHRFSYLFYVLDVSDLCCLCNTPFHDGSEWVFSFLPF